MPCLERPALAALLLLLPGVATNDFSRSSGAKVEGAHAS